MHCTNNLLKQIIRFLFVGGSAFIIDFALLWVFTDLMGINYLISNCLSFSISVIYNYILSVVWVFDVDENRNKKNEFVAFIVLSVIGLGINQVIYWGCVKFFKMHYLISKIGATAVVMVYNFITRKIFLEKR